MGSDVTDQPLDPSVLFTRRLALVPMSCVLMRAIITKNWTSARSILGTRFPFEWRSDTWEWLAPRVVDGELSPSSLVWGTRLARLAAGEGEQRGPIIAEVGFHGPPDGEGWVEIGYRVVIEHRREGFAEEAATGLITWAIDQGVRGVRASVSPENVASSRLLRKLDFIETGSYRDSTLGEQLSFCRPAHHVS